MFTVIRKMAVREGSDERNKKIGKGKKRTEGKMKNRRRKRKEDIVRRGKEDREIEDENKERNTGKGKVQKDEGNKKTIMKEGRRNEEEKS